MFLSSPNKSQQTEEEQEGEPDPEPLFDNDNDNLFDTDDENCPWWSEDDICNSDYNDQQYIPIPNKLQPQISPSNYIQQPEGISQVPYFDSNPINNKNKTLTSHKLSPTLKSWICEHCNAINNLYHSLEEREFQCISCNNYYRPGQILIESKEELYTVWICNHCSYHNDIQWNKCHMCLCNKPQTHLQIFCITHKPKSISQSDCNYNYLLDGIINDNNVPFPLSQSMQFKVNCKVNNDMEDKKGVDIASNCNNKHNIASNCNNKHNIASNCKHNTKEKKHRSDREFDELQNYKSDLFCDKNMKHENNKFDLFCDKNMKHENNKLNCSTSNWNCDFKFMK